MVSFLELTVITGIGRESSIEQSSNDLVRFAREYEKNPHEWTPNDRKFEDCWSKSKASDVFEFLSRFDVLRKDLANFLNSTTSDPVQTPKIPDENSITITANLANSFECNFYRLFLVKIK